MKGARDAEEAVRALPPLGMPPLGKKGRGAAAASGVVYAEVGLETPRGAVPADVVAAGLPPPPMRRLPTGLSDRIHAALGRPLATDFVTAEQWLAVDAAQLARYLTLADERLYHCVGHSHLLS